MTPRTYDKKSMDKKAEPRLEKEEGRKHKKQNWTTVNSGS